MVDPFSATDVQIQFYEQTAETAVVGYETNLMDATRLFSELQFVVTTVLDEESVETAEGAIFHNDAPVIATWEVKAEWTEQFRSGTLSTAGLLTKVLQRLETSSFQ